MGQNDEYIKVASSIPGLKSKIQVRMDGPADIVYWYIKFNIPLDESSVSRNTMNVTDTEGYILETEISYNKFKHLIVITPLETYEQNEYYLLNISKRVRSEKENELKNDIHILFKLKGNQISEFKILPKNVQVPTPRRRIQEKPIHSRVFQFDKEGKAPKKKEPKRAKIGSSDLASEQLPLFLDFPLNPIVGIIGVVLAVISAIVNIGPLVIGSLAVAFAGLAHIVFQITRKKFRTLYFYNRGVMAFNKGNYAKAQINFDKAMVVDPQNEYAEYARGKTAYYL